MNDNFIDELKKKSKENTWQVLNLLKDGMSNYIFASGVFDKEKAAEVNNFIMYLINITRNNSYAIYIKDLIDRFVEIIFPGILRYSKEERKKIFMSLFFEIRAVLIKKLSEKIPKEELQELWDEHFSNFLGLENPEDLELPESLSYEEQIDSKLKENIELAKKSIMDFGKELTAPYEEEIKKMEEIMALDKSYIEKNKVPEYIRKEIKGFRDAKRNKEKPVENRPLIIKGEGKKQVEKVKLPLEILDKKQVDQLVSQKPDIKDERETIHYEKDLSKVVGKKGVSVEGMNIPKEERIPGEAIEKQPGLVLEEEKVVIDDIAFKSKQQGPPEEKKSGQKTHYDQSEVIKKIKEQQKGKSSIDSKVE